MAEEEKQEEVKKSLSIMPLVQMVLLALLIGVSGFNSWQILQLKSQAADKRPAPSAEATIVSESGEELTTMDLGDITVNLADTGVERFLRVKIKIDVAEEGKERVDASMPKLNDLVITVLSSKRFESVRTPQGKAALKEELIYRLNRALGGTPIKSLYFTDFVSQ